MSARQVRRFQLERDVDVSGVSGTGSVAYGAQAPDGTCVLWWNSEHGSVAIYPSMDALLAIHGHAGRTRAVYIDPPEAAGDLLSVVPATPTAAAGASAVAAQAAAPPRAARIGGWRAVTARGGGTRGGGRSRAGSGRPARTWPDAATGSVTTRMIARGGAARSLQIQVSGRKHGAAGPSGSIV